MSTGNSGTESKMTKQDIVKATDRAIDNAGGDYDVLGDGTIEIDADRVANELGIGVDRLERIFTKNAGRLLQAGLRLMVRGEEGALTVLRASRL
jgi:hypothetical protein